LLFGRNDDVILGNRVRRRALGATKGHIRVQFLAEAILLALLGGATGALATAIYASTTGWAVVTAGCEAPGSGSVAGHKGACAISCNPGTPGTVHTAGIRETAWPGWRARRDSNPSLLTVNRYG
jgi:predicted lysophospholipase L1 biosynthesis ABC-type transport system permease subunit